MSPTQKVNSNLKFTSDNIRYIIDIKPLVFSNSLFYKVFRTDSQIKDLLTEAVKDGFIAKAKKCKEPSSLFFDSKDGKFIFFFEAKEHPENEKIGALIELLAFSRLDEKSEAIIKTTIKPENTHELKHYTIPYRLVPRTHDHVLNTFGAYGLKCKICLSNYVKEKKDWFIERYDIENFLMSLMSTLHQKNLIQKHLDNTPFLVCAKGEEELYLTTLSLTSSKFKGEVFHNILLDDVHKRDIKEATEVANEKGEEIYMELNITLKRRMRPKTEKRVLLGIKKVAK